MAIVLLLLIPAALLLAAGGAAAWNPEISDKDDPSKTYNFLAIGDWGDDSADQHANAAGMGVVAEEIDAALVIALGDNFYHSSKSHCDTSGGHYGGICNNNTDGIDGVDRFETTFEQVYTAESLRRVPWYAIAGNHDHAGNVTAQIGYTTNAQNYPLPDGRGLPPTRWNFPDYYHNVTKRFEIPGSDGKIVELEFLLYDSSIMAGNPADPATAAAQLKWLEERMAASTSDYLWVGGHYPVWAIGQDPPTGINPILRPLLHKWEANYFNGHEHDLEHIVERGSKVNYICTGAGKFCCYADKNLDTVPQGSIQFAMSGRGGSDWWGRRPWSPPEFEMLAGFTSYRIGTDSMRVYFHAHNGTLLYITQPILPRTKTPQPPVPPPAPFCSTTTCPANWTRTSPTPTPGTFPPSPPTPPAPTPPGTAWECHKNMQPTGPAVAKLKQTDHTTPPFGLETATASACEDTCEKIRGCKVIMWHDSDRHCHTLTGPITAKDFAASLQPAALNGRFVACMLVETHPNIPRRDLA